MENLLIVMGFVGIILAACCSSMALVLVAIYQERKPIQKDVTLNRHKCGVKGCDEPVYEFGGCFKHYVQREPF